MRTPSEIVGTDNVSKLQRQGYVIISKDHFFHLRRALQVVVEGLTVPQPGDLSSLNGSHQSSPAVSRTERQAALADSVF